MIKALIQAFRYPAAPHSRFEVEREDRTIRGEYAKVIDLIRRKYYRIDPKGSRLVRLLIDFRASVISGGEISLSGQEQTVTAINQFIETENINRKLIEYTALAEREGRLALVLYRKGDGFGIRALPWHQYKYKLIYDKFETVIGITYPSDDGDVTIRKPYLIYMQYAGQEEYSDETQAPPKIGYCLDDIEVIEDELSRWANINHFFADPTPHFDTEDENFFDKLLRLLKGKTSNESPQGSISDENVGRKWKVGEGIATWKTKFTFVQAEMRGIESLDRHIQVRAQFISSMTGFPIFLLYPELMSNRATADEIAAESNHAMVIERSKHEELWTEVFKSFCIASNLLMGTALNPNRLYVVLPQSSPSQIQLLIKTYLPLLQSSIISTETFRELLPGIEPELEAERLDNQTASQVSGLSNALFSEGLV